MGEIHERNKALIVPSVLEEANQIAIEKDF